MSVAANYNPDSLVDPSFWNDEDRVHSWFAQAREHHPICKSVPRNFRPFWSVTKHADIKDIELASTKFHSNHNSLLLPKHSEQLIRMAVGRESLIPSLIEKHGDQHRSFRALTTHQFSKSQLANLRTQLRLSAKKWVDYLYKNSKACNLTEEVTNNYPLEVIIDLLGFPTNCSQLVLNFTQRLFASSDLELRSRRGAEEDYFEMFHKFEQLIFDEADSRKKSPVNDLASEIANARINGRPLKNSEIIGYFGIFLTAGHISTGAVIAGGINALISHPDQWELLKQEREKLLPSAIDEMIRWVSPVRHFLRTASEDLVVGDMPIANGDTVALWYPSANRDEETFDNPNDFQIDRKPNNHLGFGIGSHACLGKHLAVLEISTFFEELLDRVEKIELIDEPKYINSIYVGGLSRLPVKLYFH